MAGVGGGLLLRLVYNPEFLHLGFPFKEEDAKINLKRFNDRVVVKRLEPEAVRKDGNSVPDTAEDKVPGGVSDQRGAGGGEEARAAHAARGVLT